MRALTYYVATTIDGFIAGPGGEWDFFPVEPDVTELLTAEFPETVPTQFRAQAGLAEDVPNKRFDTVLMGRGTYEAGLPVTNPYAHLRQYVYSRTLSGTPPEVQVVAEDPLQHLRRLKREDGLGIWLCGGTKLAGTLRDEIDELVIKRYPVAIGTGMPLFDRPFHPETFAATGTHVFDSGAVVTMYRRAT